MNQNPQDFEKLRQFLSVNRAVENLKNVIPIETSFNTQYQSRLNEYKQKLKQCQENNEKFTDTEFPPTENSLSYSNFEKLSVSKKQIWKQIQWLRPSEFLDKNQEIHIFEKPFGSSANVIEPNDIRQGKLGNCYFLSALSSIAEQPKLIKRLFTSSEYNEFGIYAIWLHINGEWQQIIIDDYIPCFNGQPIFSKNTGNEIWVMLIEKAYAKAYGSYEIIDQGGNPAYALKELTGAPCFNFDKNKQLTGQQQEQEFWNFVSKNFRNEYVITCYTEMTGKQDQENALGLLSGHSYAILRAEQVVSSAGKSERIFKIRNPWASKEWRGDWADDSYLWTQELRKLLEVEQKDDGCFWINTKDFTKYFLGIGVCKVNDGFKFNSINLNTDIQEQFMVRVKVERDSHLLISLNQIDQKMFKNDPGYKYAFLQVLAGKMNQQNQSLDFMEGDFKQERSVSIESQFQKGDYIVLISARQFPKYKHKMVLSTYSENDVNLEILENLDFNNYMGHMFKGYVNQLPGNQKLQIQTKFNDNINLVKYSSYIYGTKFVYYSNLTNDKTIKENLFLEQYTGFQVQQPFEDNEQNNFQFEIPAHQELVICFQFNAIEDGRCTISPSYNTQIIDYVQFNYLNGQDFDENKRYLLKPITDVFNNMVVQYGQNYNNNLYNMPQGLGGQNNDEDEPVQLFLIEEYFVQFVDNFVLATIFAFGVQQDQRQQLYVNNSQQYNGEYVNLQDEQA